MVSNVQNTPESCRDAVSIERHALMKNLESTKTPERTAGANNFV
jgi:hypothetical protein